MVPASPVDILELREGSNEDDDVVDRDQEDDVADRGPDDVAEQDHNTPHHERADQEDEANGVADTEPVRAAPSHSLTGGGEPSSQSLAGAGGGESFSHSLEDGLEPSSQRLRGGGEPTSQSQQEGGEPASQSQQEGGELNELT